MATIINDRIIGAEDEKVTVAGDLHIVGNLSATVTDTTAADPTSDAPDVLIAISVDGVAYVIPGYTAT